MGVKLGGEFTGKELITKEELDEASRGIREDFIAIFGIFASLFIFLSIEIQVLKQATRFSLLVGFSLFLLGALLTFIYSLRHINKDQHRWKDYWNPLTLFIISCFIGSAFCFAWAKLISP